MGRSLCTTLSPFMAAREPAVVIVGKLAGGVVGPDTTGKYAIARRLFLAGVATSAPGHTFSVLVERPGTGMPDYFVSGLTTLANQAGLGNSSVYNSSGGNDAPASVRMLSGVDELYRYPTVSAAEESSDGRRVLGQIVTSDDVRITIKGLLNSLDPLQLMAGTVGNVSDLTTCLTSVPSGLTRTYDFPGYGPGVGWRPYEIRVFGQLPGLRSSLASVQPPCHVIWD